MFALKSTFAAGALLVSTSFALAGDNNACRADVERLCPAARGDRGAVRACMKANADQLSAECTAHRAARKAKRKGKKAERWANSACRPDAERLCAAEMGDRKALKACMKANVEQLSPECTAERAERKAKRKDRKARRKAHADE